MKRLLIALMLLPTLAFGQAFTIGDPAYNNPAPAAAGGGGELGLWSVTTYATNAAFTIATNSVPANSWLVVGWADESDSASQANAGFTATPTLTFAKVTDASAASSANAEIWTNFFAAGGNLSLAFNNQSGKKQSAVLWVFTNMNTVQMEAAAAFTNRTGTATPDANASFITAVNNSYVVGVCSDFSATAGSLVTTNGVTLDLNDFQSTAYRGVFFHKLVSTAATDRYGMQAPASATGIGIALVRVRP